jgi:hypothetical protein
MPFTEAEVKKSAAGGVGKWMKLWWIALEEFEWRVCEQALHPNQ